jgi:transposase
MVVFQDQIFSTGSWILASGIADALRSGNPTMEAHQAVDVVLRPNGSKGFVLLPKRWTVERTYGWLHWRRRLNVDYERLPASSEAFIHIAMIRLMLRRLA